MDQASSGSGIYSILMLVGAAVLLYFLYIKPQKKRDKERIQMHNMLKIGDVVVTIGGIIGIITSIKEEVVVLETGSDKNKIRIKKWAIKNIEKIN